MRDPIIETPTFTIVKTVTFKDEEGQPIRSYTVNETGPLLWGSAHSRISHKYTITATWENGMKAVYETPEMHNWGHIDLNTSSFVCP